MKSYMRYLCAIVTAAAMLIASLPAVAGTLSQPPPPEQNQAKSLRSPEAEPTKIPAGPVAISSEAALAKIHPKLRDLAQTATPTMSGLVPNQVKDPTVKIMVTARPGTDLSRYMDRIIPTRELFDGEQDFYGQVTASRLMKLATLPDVISIIQVTLERDGTSPIPPEELANQPKPKDWDELRANAGDLRAGSLPWDQAKASGDGKQGMITPMDWFEVTPAGPHKAQAAWARGFDGTGVVATVNDDGVDWAHPDLMGMQKIYATSLAGDPNGVCGPKGCAAAYNGWPMSLSPFSLFLYVSDSVDGTSYIANGQPGLHYADTRKKPALTLCGAGLMCFDYAPLIAYATPGPLHTYVISSTMSKSGVVHVGTHPDNNLRDFVWGEKAAVLVTDPNVAGVYDTVYVDLDDDYDFRDEKPLTRADTTSAATLDATKNNMIAYRDMDGDGKADLSGGALYFIADGVTPLPFAWTVYFAWAAPPPGNGDLVAFDGPWDTGESHGTLCASNVVGQGAVNGLLPAFSDLPGTGVPAGAVYGAAKSARLVDVSNIYWDFANSKLTAYTFAVYGYDGYRSSNAADTDGIQITSNSYGSSDQDNDSWEYDGRYISRRQRGYAPYLSMLFSTGNGAPGFGTTAPPSPDTGIAVGASTQYGSTGWDSITSTQQIMFNDVAWYSNRGPSARGTVGVDVLADGQRGAGDLNLNYSVGTWGLDGNMAWATWGGTSRSAPAAMGNLAVLYQAFRAKNGRWPTYLEARALLKSTSTDLDYDVLTQGAGSVNTDRGSAVAAGWYGLYITPDEWDPGAYRGTDYPAFAHVMTPTQTAVQTFTVNNPGVTPITAQIIQGDPKLIRSQTFDYTITPAMSAAMSADNFFKAPQFIIPMTATLAKIAANPWWNNIAIPGDTELMMVTMRYPYNEFDANGDYQADNRWRLILYNWKDVNGNHKVWDDKNSNGVVNFTTAPAVTQIDGGQELNWSDPANELDRWEFGRFDYARPAGTVLRLPVHDPLARMQDGLFIGLQQYAGSPINQTHLTFQIDFYKYSDVPWLATSASSLVVPAGGSATFQVTASTNNTPAGLYQAAIKVTDPGGTISGQVPGPSGPITLPLTTLPAHTSVIPVAMVVAPDYTEGMTFGGATQAAAEADRLYDNAVVRGYNDWTWRAESGDWRFFFFDNKSTPLAGTRLIVKDEWADAAPHTDIDTIIMGPTLDAFSPGGNFANPAYYGPYTLATKGKSPNTNISAGIWRFNTSSGGAEDWVTAPFQEGLHLVAQHNVLFEGDKFGVVFTKTVGTIRATPQAVELWTYLDQGSQDIVVQSSLPLPGMMADAFGLGGPQRFSWQVPFGSSLIDFTHEFSAAHAAKIEIDTSSPNISDIDIYLYRWTGTTWAQIASSAGGTSIEHILVQRPADGRYLLGIDNYSGPAGTVDVVLKVVQGNDLTVTGTTSNLISPNTPVTLKLEFNKMMKPGEAYEGLLLLGPAQAPGALEIPVIIHRLVSSAKIEKTVNYKTGFPGAELIYDINLYNLSDPLADFRFTDPIPANTEFVTVTNATYDALHNQVVYTGALPIGALPTDTEGFENGVVPPVGWSRQAKNANYSWQVDDADYVHDGNFGAWVPWDYDQDEWLFSPYLGGLTGGETVSFWSQGSITWCRDAYDNCDLKVWLVVDAPGGDDVLLGDAEDNWLANWIWARTEYTLPMTLPAGDLRIAFEYVGDDAADVGLDDIMLPGTPQAFPSLTVNVTVRILETAVEGSTITNTATLTVTHTPPPTLPKGQQIESAGASAFTHIGMAEFGTSYKQAPAQAATGSNITYKVHVKNTGDKLETVTFTDPIPGHTSYVSHDSSAPNQLFSYDVGAEKMVWTGSIAPDDERVFTFVVKVDADPLLWGSVVTNTATIAWGSKVMPLTASTEIRAAHQIYLPLVLR